MQLPTDTVTVIYSDATAKALLASENMLQAMIPKPPFDHTSVIWANETHFCTASYDCGHENPKDNGYIVIAVPKQLLPIEQVADLFKAFMEHGKAFGPMTPCEEEIVYASPQRN